MAQLFRHLRVHQIFGANTDVGKTVIAAALARASTAQGRRVFYLKPVNAGPLASADDKFVERYAGRDGRVQSTCLFRFEQPVSPHLAARLEHEQSAGKIEIPTDASFVNAISAYIRKSADEGGAQKADMYVETAGGVHSPMPSGTPQADAYRPLRLPTVLVGDAQLGGISATIAAYESLELRGHTVDVVLLFHDAGFDNCAYLTSYFAERGVRVSVIAAPPPRLPGVDENFVSTERYYKDLIADGSILDVVKYLDQQHAERIDALASMSRRALDTVWWPFVQHGLVKREEDVTVIDSAHGDFFSVYDPPPADGGDTQPLLRAQLDGSASWWTQTFGHGHPALALAAARAAGRYGHVLFPQAANAPAVSLAARMLAGPGAGWAARVFFSDDGSTAMEVALKMALRAFTARHGGALDPAARRRLGVLGLRGSYHGDTLGAMDACDAGGGVYTCEWHDAKGCWLDPPAVGVRRGRAVITLPPAIAESAGLAGGEVEGESLPWVYDVAARLRTPLAAHYREYVTATLARLRAQGEPRLAALVMEPLVLGAGGMIFVDPLFQRVLIDAVRALDDGAPAGAWRGLPVIFDEVFTGLYRTGAQSCGPLLGAAPDIAVYAKTLTGGLVPLALTLAGASVFDAFRSGSKADALLHGHSYTAHAVGCEVAHTSLGMMARLAESPAWVAMREKWRGALAAPAAPAPAPAQAPVPPVWSFWDPGFVAAVSHLDVVDSVMTLGTVLAIKLRSEQGGYQSQSAQTVLASIGRPAPHDPSGSLEDASFGIHFRTLGDVAYFMSSLNTADPILRSVEQKILAALTQKG